MSQIVLRDVRKNYQLGELDVPVLNGVSLEIERGEMVSLIGASGSGKTTLMNILGCLDRVSSGEYFLSGRNVGGLSSDARAAIRSEEIGFVFQSFNLLSRTSAKENVLMPLDYARKDDSLTERRQRDERAGELLKRVGLADRMEHFPSQLSGGQQQRVAIARALVNRPSILLADEPTGNLDSATSNEILEMFRVLSEEERVTIVLVTHDADVASWADRTIRVRDGRIEKEERA
jgi:ABC-type lipoprotein export system ATPase subunit